MAHSKLKTILLIIGSGVGGILLFIAAAMGFLYYKFSPSISSTPISLPAEKTITEVPQILEVGRFLGSSGIFARGFIQDRNVLASGPGQLVGQITIDGKKPVIGLKLQLALNGKVMSQWATTDANGKYEIKVPFAQYRIDGYNLDLATADITLKNKIDNPQNPHKSEIMTVGENNPGKALHLDFIDPIQLTGPMGNISSSQSILISWKSYPGAETYKLQLMGNPPIFSISQKWD